MQLFLLIVLCVTLVKLSGIGSTLKSIDAHNRRFTPEPREKLNSGDVIVLKANGTEQVFAVAGVAESDTGKLYVTVESAS